MASGDPLSSLVCFNPDDTEPTSAHEAVTAYLAKNPKLAAMMDDYLRYHMEHLLGEQLFGQPALA